MTAMIATGVNAQKLPPEMRGTPKTAAPDHLCRSINNITEGARQVLNHIENNGTEDRYVIGYVRADRKYVLNAQQGDRFEMVNVLEALTKIKADTECLKYSPYPFFCFM